MTWKYVSVWGEKANQPTHPWGLSRPRSGPDQGHCSSMKGGLTGPCARMCTCSLSLISSAPSANGLTRPSQLDARGLPVILTPNNGRFASSCLRFSHFQNTYRQRPLSSRLTLKILDIFRQWTCSSFQELVGLLTQTLHAAQSLC